MKLPSETYLENESAFPLHIVAMIEKSERELIERAEKAEKELSELKERTRWIPVSERLPEEGEYVLAYYKARKPYVRILECTCGTWYGPEGFPLSFTITHWMPLPLPPTE